jgi:hypothetical protein
VEGERRAVKTTKDVTQATITSQLQSTADVLVRDPRPVSRRSYPLPRERGTVPDLLVGPGGVLAGSLSDDQSAREETVAQVPVNGRPGQSFR